MVARLSVRRSFVTPFQGSRGIRGTRPQGGACGYRRGALPWADLLVHLRCGRHRAMSHLSLRIRMPGIACTQFAVAITPPPLAHHCLTDYF